MALLQLKDIGKIYVSEGNVAVGIRGVNLSFDRGEFVAITGMSGSGKSTLLNVISGMDTYEEGELFIEGQGTAHYLQPDWEEYRRKYISFIFQDYNIIESFTVLQNVELALMHIEDKAERRARAEELLKRVGLGSHMRQKGSKLSGGQKQRTVIARALAKDSPIILADEPTGNLDSATSKEIIELLREVSKDKLLIVVTHNFEQVEDYATRHIRVFDGAVESDHVISSPIVESVPVEQESKASARKREVKNGIVLGRTIFTAKPRLSIFLCLLLLVGTAGIFSMTSLCGVTQEYFRPMLMFQHIEGRVVLTKPSGQPISDEELAKLAEEYGAKSALHYDMMLDSERGTGVRIPEKEEWEPDAWDSYAWTRPVYGKDYGTNIYGEYPDRVDEVLLYLPISFKPYYGEELIGTKVYLDKYIYTLSGLKFFYDNTKNAEALFTEEGFRLNTALYYLSGNRSMSISAVVKGPDGAILDAVETYFFQPNASLAPGTIYSGDKSLNAVIDGIMAKDPNNTLEISFQSEYEEYDYFGVSSQVTRHEFEKSYGKEILSEQAPILSEQESELYGTSILYLSPELLCDVAEGVLAESYRQASLFFENDKEAEKAAKALRADGYIAAPSTATYQEADFEHVMNMILSLVLWFVWGMGIIFLAFFINLCSTRTLSAFKGDMAIMRSMGISVNVIRIGMYVRMLISLIPGFVFVAVAAIGIFTSPKMNKWFVYLHAWEYVLIVIAMIAMTTRITYKQIHKLFGESVKKSLKGGNAE